MEIRVIVSFFQRQVVFGVSQLKNYCACGRQSL